MKPYQKQQLRIGMDNALTLTILRKCGLFKWGNFLSNFFIIFSYPVVEVKRIDSKKVVLSQKRFKLDESALEKSKFRNAKYW